jgi:putative tryptophan/tyrosine transport system substrate-binding protein
MKRRAFIAALGGAAAWPVVARAQQPERMRRIAVLSPAADRNPIDEAFEEVLRQRGWVPGRNITIEIRYTRGRQDAVAPIVAEIAV